MMGFMYRKVKNIHFVGIGGIGMSGIAEVLLNMGYCISGSDLNETEITKRLASLGAKVFFGHAPSNLGNADVVITSTAVRDSNPEVIAAREKNIPVIPRAEMLAELLKMKFSIAVSGSHGKTTTTSMIATILAHGGLDPTIVLGGKLTATGSNARLGNGEYIVAEADESDGSFLKLSPTISVITNIDLEHLEYYRDIEEIKGAFLQFANSVPFYGSTILCFDDDNVAGVLPKIKRKTITYGLTDGADYRAKDISYRGLSSTFALYYRCDFLEDISLNVPGIFNIYNAMAAVAVARELDMPVGEIRDGLKSYIGVHRRLEIKGEVNGIVVVDDYGHHPTEIRATLKAAREVWDRRIIVVFQPHRYTRTKALFDQFLTAFSDADALILADIYPASEKGIEGVHSSKLCHGIRERGHRDVTYISDFNRIVDRLLEIAQSTDVIITLGAGDIWKTGEEFLRRAAKN